LFHSNYYQNESAGICYDNKILKYSRNLYITADCQIEVELKYGIVIKQRVSYFEEATRHEM
jgi:hypothetical protein